MTTVEYNKIHVLASARSRLIRKFNGSMLNLWPLADDGPFIRDLLRRQPLVGYGVSVQAPGLLDYGVDVQGGFLSDVVGDQGDHNYESTPTKEANDYYLAVHIPAGRWKSMKFRNTGSGVLSPGVVIAASEVSPSSVVGEKVIQANSVVEESKAFNYEYTAGVLDQDIYSSGAHTNAAGQIIVLDGVIKKASFRLKKVGSPTGYVVVHARDAEDASLCVASIDVTTLTTDYAWYDFYFAGFVDIDNAVTRVTAEYVGGDSSNYVKVQYTQTGGTLFGGYTYRLEGEWTDVGGTSDCNIKIEGVIPLHKCTFPFSFDASEGQFWAYLKGNSHYDSSETHGMTGRKWSGSAWVEQEGLLAEFQGVDAAWVWPALDKFTVGVVVNVDNSPCNGYILALADASEAKAYLSVTSAKKVEGYFKNKNGDTSTPIASDQLHLGHNLITLSYEKNVKVKLGINGVVVDEKTPTNNDLFDTTLALGVGTLMKTGKTTSGQLKNAVIDDLWLASDVLSDTDLWNVYMSYITAAPLMQLEDITPYASYNL